MANMTKKNWMIIGVIGAAGFLIALFSALYLLLWAPPGKTDFEHAHTDVEKLFAAYDKVSDTYAAYQKALTRDNTDPKTEQSAYDDAKSKVMAGLDTVADTKALRDQELKKKYDELVQKTDVTFAYTDGFTTYRKVLYNCIDLFSVSKNIVSEGDFLKNHDAAAKDCTPALDRLKKSPTKVFADYGKGFSEVVAARRQAFADLSKAKIDRAKVLSIMTEQAAKLEKVNAAAETGISAAFKQTGTADALKSLDGALHDRIKRSK